MKNPPIFVGGLEDGNFLDGGENLQKQMGMGHIMGKYHEISQVYGTYPSLGPVEGAKLQNLPIHEGANGICSVYPVSSGIKMLG